MFVLCNTGHWGEAIEKTEQRLTLNREPWVHSILAWLKLHQERNQEAEGGD